MIAGHLRVAGFLILLSTGLAPLRTQVLQHRPAVPGAPDAGRRTPPYQDEDLIEKAVPDPPGTRYLPLHVLGADHLPVANLASSDVNLLIDGHARAFTLMRPWRMPSSNSTSQEDVPFVLIVLPPNQPIVHHLILLRLQKHFAREKADGAGRVPWYVAVVDSDGTSTRFTRDRAELLGLFASLEKKVSPMIRTGTSAESNWEAAERNAIALMRFLPGRKVVLEVEPDLQRIYSIDTEPVMFHWLPASSLEDVRQAGATMFLVNPAGPTDSDELNLLQTSLLWQTADAGGGNFNNSLDTILQEIADDRYANYLLRYMAGPYDDDRASQVQVVLRNRKLHSLIGTPYSRSALFSEATEKPDGSATVIRLTGAMRKAASTGNLRLAVRADSFPNRSGRYNTVPLSAEVQWLGDGTGPREIEVMESLEMGDPNPLVMNTGKLVIARRHLTVQWNGREVSWVRVNRLMPGDYTWRVAAGDRADEAVASAVTQFRVQPINPEHVALSSLVLTRGCGANNASQSAIPARQGGGKDKSRHQRELGQGGKYQRTRGALTPCGGSRYTPRSSEAGVAQW